MSGCRANVAGLGREESRPTRTCGGDTSPPRIVAALTPHSTMQDADAKGVIIGEPYRRANAQRPII